MSSDAHALLSSTGEMCIHAGWIVSVDPQNTIFKDHTLVVKAGRIIDCLPTDDAKRHYPSFVSVDRHNHILMPGLVNAHTHLAMNLLRGIGSDQPLMRWLNDYIWPSEAAHVSEAFVRDGTRLAVAECLLSGVTTVNDMYFFPGETAQICEQAGIRACIGLTVLEFPTNWAANADNYLAKGLDVHARFEQSALISTTLAPHAPYTVSVKTLERIAALSDDMSLPVHIHLQETQAEVENYQKEHGLRPIGQLDKIGLLSPSLIAVHLTQLSHTDIQQLSERGVTAVHCPESNLKLASGFCPISSLVENGVNVAIGTDGAASNNDLDLLGEMRTAALLAKAVSGDAASVSATEGVRMATINGARALQLDHDIGSLEIGKSADFIAIDVDLTLLPMLDVMAQIVYAVGRERVSDVWVAGRQLLEGRKLTTLDPDQIKHSARQWQSVIGN